MFDGSDEAVPPDSPGAVRIEGAVIDGDGAPVAWPECFLEFWHGDQWARTRTDERGRLPRGRAQAGAETMPDGSVAAPHVNVAVFARGLLKQALTRVYFPDEDGGQRRRPGPRGRPAPRTAALLVARAGRRSSAFRHPSFRARTRRRSSPSESRTEVHDGS